VTSKSQSPYILGRREYLEQGNSAELPIPPSRLSPPPKMSKELTAEHHHDGDHQDVDRGAASEDSHDDPRGCGLGALQLLSIRANCPIRAINGYDLQLVRFIYRQQEGEVQEVRSKLQIVLVFLGSSVCYRFDSH
jgi:hypothetical protein